MSNYRYRSDFFWYKPEPPLEVKGGIRAGSRRGGFAASWWGRRWIEVLESFQIGARLGRGRSYARRGQVANLEVEKGIVRAKVQGTQAKPYHVIIELQTLSKSKWLKVVRGIGKRPIITTKLLGAEMPAELEDVFAQAGVALFPEKYNDLETACSCPDWSNPCKHIAAVYYLLAEAFDQDPFLLLKLRGLGREEFVSLLRGSVKSNALPPPALETPLNTERSRAAEPLCHEPGPFWGIRQSGRLEGGRLAPPAMPASLPHRLGAFPFWRGREGFLNTMERVYSLATAAAERMLGADTMMDMDIPSE